MKYNINRERESELIGYDDYTIEETELEGINGKYEEIIENLEVGEHLYKRDSFISNSHSEEDKIRRALEMMGSKIISANDVESNRKIDYKFWKDDREFRKHMESEVLIGVHRTEDDGEEGESNLIDENVELDQVINWTELIDMSNNNVVRALIQSLSEADEYGSLLNNILMQFNLFIENEIKMSKGEKNIVNMLRKGLNQSDIANELDVSRASVAQSITRLTNKVIDSGVDILDIIPPSYQCFEAFDENI